MIHLPESVRVDLCLTACAMRKSFEGLHALVRDHLSLDAFGGHCPHALREIRLRLHACRTSATFFSTESRRSRFLRIFH